MTEEGHASGSLLNSSNHQPPGKMKPVDVTHPLSTNGVLQGVGDKESFCLPMAQEIHLRELCCRYPFQDRLWDGTRNRRIYTLYSTQQHVFKVTKTGINALNSLFLFHFKIKISGMVLVHKNLIRPSRVRDHLSTCSPPERLCFHNTATDKKSRWWIYLGVWDGRTWIWKELSFGMSQNQRQAVLLLENQPHRFPSLHPSQTMKKKKKRE